MKNKNNKGLALVIVLSLIVVVVLVVEEITSNIKWEYRSAVANLNRLRAYYSAKAGMDINILRVKTYLKLIQAYGKKQEMQAVIPYMNLIWQFPFSWPPSVPAGASSIAGQELKAMTEKSFMIGQLITSIQPENGRIDVNDLASPIPSLRSWTFEVLHRLILHLQSEDPVLSENLSEQDITEVLLRMKDWVDIDDNQGDTVVSEKDLYTLEGLPPNRSFLSQQELLQVVGMSPVLYQALSPFITVYGEKGLNINTAPAKLLMALHEEFPLELAEEIVALRSQPAEPVFWTPETFAQFLNQKGFDILAQELQNKPQEEKNQPTYGEGSGDKVSYILFSPPRSFKMRSKGWVGKSQRTITAGYFDTSFVIERFHHLMQEEIKKEEKNIKAELAKTQVVAYPDKSKENEENTKKPPPAPKAIPAIVYWKESF